MFLLRFRRGSGPYYSGGRSKNVCTIRRGVFWKTGTARHAFLLAAEDGNSPLLVQRLAPLDLLDWMDIPSLDLVDAVGCSENFQHELGMLDHTPLRKLLSMAKAAVSEFLIRSFASERCYGFTGFYYPGPDGFSYLFLSARTILYILMI